MCLVDRRSYITTITVPAGRVKGDQADSTTGTATFSYDALDRLTQASHPGPTTWAWTYDALGNRTQQTGSSGTTAYTYDANNRLMAAGATTYSYDANGNLVSTSSGQSFTHDVFNRMTQATGSGGTVTHTYNGDGLKTQRVGPGGTTRYYYDGIRPIYETDSAGIRIVQIDRDIFGNLLSRLEASGTRYELHADGLGSISALTSHNGGAVAATMLYDAWGNLRSSPNSAHGTYRFTGAEWDGTTGLYHMGARFYDPYIGRWLSEDPVQDQSFEPATLNFYTYADGNPLRFTDPGGETIQDQVKEWLNVGTDYAKLKLKEFYDLMVQVYEVLSENHLTGMIGVGIGVLSALTFSYQGLDFGAPSIPNPSTPLGKLVADLRSNPSAWRIAAARAEQATGRAYRGGVSIKLVFQRVRDGATIGYHFVVRNRQVVDPHFRQGPLYGLLKWLLGK